MLTIIKDVEDSIFICEPHFLYYFLLIATMTKTMFVNSQQLLFIILFMCEVVTPHKINMILLFFNQFPQDHSKIAKPSTQNYSLLYISRTRLHR